MPRRYHESGIESLEAQKSTSLSTIDHLIACVHGSLLEPGVKQLSPVKKLDAVGVTVNDQLFVFTKLFGIVA